MDKTKITWYGHAAIGIQTAGFRLLVDPYLNDNPKSAARAEDVEADYILISHGHGDHIGDAVSIAKRCNAKIIANTEVARWLGKQGVETHGQSLGGGFRYPFGYLKLVYALHGASLPDGSYGGVAAGFVLTVENNQKIYIAGDTGLFGDMRLIGEEGICLALLPIGDNYTMGPADALRAVKLLQPQQVIPIHYDTFDFIRQDPIAWASQVESETAARVHVLKPGDSFSL
ncbi:MAG: metal-dependent hydrolase [Anaerolineae bacterium]|nr:metal-dependent hydrolase [Anaerolineae bacterium]